MATLYQRVLIVGDDNFTLTKCIIDNLEQWILKTSPTPPAGSAAGEAGVNGVNETQNGGGSSSLKPDEGVSSSASLSTMAGSPPQHQQAAPSSGRQWKIEVASCLPENKIPHEYVGNLEKLRAQGIGVHFSVNPALLRQYFVNYDPARAAAEASDRTEDQGTGPPYDIVLFVLPGLQFDGCPRYIERTSDLFKLRLHLYFFALTKSSTVITKPNGSIMFLWLDQEKSAGLIASNQLPFPLVDIHKLGPFCKVLRSEPEDFRLNLSWGDYKTQWKPLVHNLEHLHFPAFLEDLKVYCFRNSPYIPTARDDKHKQQSPIANGGGANNKDADDGNFLRIPHTICQWDRAILPHVNELFHFSMRTCSPGEVILISKLSVKYDPRITGWRNSGHLSRDLYRQQGQQPAAVQPAQGGTARQVVNQTQISPAGNLTAYPSLAVGGANGWPQPTQYPFQSNPYFMQPSQQPPNVLGFLAAGSLNDFDSLIQQPAYETGWTSASAYWAQTQPQMQMQSQQPQQQQPQQQQQQQPQASQQSQQQHPQQSAAAMSFRSGSHYYNNSSSSMAAPSRSSRGGGGGGSNGPKQQLSSQQQQGSVPMSGTSASSSHDYRYSKSSQPSAAVSGEEYQMQSSSSMSAKKSSGDMNGQGMQGGEPQRSSRSYSFQSRQGGGSYPSSSTGGPPHRRAAMNGDPDHGGYGAQRSRRYRGGGPYHRAHTCRGEERPTNNNGESHVTSRRVPR